MGPVQSKAARVLSRHATTLLEWKESAYGTSLFVEDAAVLLLTHTAAIRIPDGKPAQKTFLPLGPGPALMGDSIVYWQEGAVRAVSKDGSEPRTLGSLGQRPQRFVASADRFAWLDRSADGTFSLRTFRGNAPRVLYRTPRPITVATMIEDWVFFVERTAGASWRIGGVPVSGKATGFSKTYHGRTPSMLAAARDGLHFYDGPTRSVRRLSPDLERETVLAKNVICSPLAASDRVICAHVGGVFEIPGDGISPRVLSGESAGPIATIAADERRVVWVTDTAENELAVRSVALPPIDVGNDAVGGASTR